MPLCLVAMGSNLGDRAAQLRQATVRMSRLPQSSLIARSAWHETPPIGGPVGQGAFLNAAILLSTSLEPPSLLAELSRIEVELGRQRTVRWAPRSLDLDLAVYDGVLAASAELTLPHPRMAFRRFVLEPAAEVAPWMVHPESGWTIERLLAHLNHSPESIAIAAVDPNAGEDLVHRIAQRLPLPTAPHAPAAPARPNIMLWTPATVKISATRPKLILAIEPSAGVEKSALRKMMQLPPTGPIAWIGDGADSIHEALAAVQAVWPALATPPTSPD